ncbi:oxygen tolerance family protein [Lysobacter antibioticus]|uniref:Oxygen tolerance family protein n=2 Tax=Lysobacter antibioticus TaxID=84531 RepID=A0A0S2FFH3_LYSAN|nr:oxygen tolerance family protein [Lysobacter antibioticus]
MGQFGLWLLLATLSTGAFAQTRAWLDRERINAGETVTLNVETTGSLGNSPDFAPLRGDFVLSASSSNSEMVPGKNGLAVRSQFSVLLQPRRSGRIAIPALQVGTERTQPLALEVSGEPANAPQGAGGDVFIESEADDLSPYVQQAVGWVVRLYSAVPLLAGKIDQPVPEGASLMRVGDDAQYSRDVAGRRYTVVERRFLLVPERSGALSVPAALFEGRSAPGFIDQIMGGSGDELRARARPRSLNVQALPADAPQPWLPLHDLSLRYRSTPQELRVGSAATLVVEATVDGANAAQLPELQLPPIDGVQVFPEPVQTDDGFSDGRPRVKLTRKFSLVPSRTGPTRLDGLRMDWWDVAGGKPRSSALPPLSWTIAPAGGAPASAPAVAAGTATALADALPGGVAANAAGAPLSAAPAGGISSVWALAALLFAALWLATLVWALHLRSHPASLLPKPAAEATADASAAVKRVPVNVPALRQMIDLADFDHIATVLRSLAHPPAADDDALVERLADPAQREAVQALRRARWGGGDGVAARAQLRQAFAQGPSWREVEQTAASPLPPLYPPRAPS